MKKTLRILFLGTPDFAVPSLQALINSPDEVVAVICQPDRQRGRGKKISSPPVKVVAEQAGIPVLQPTKIKTDEFYEQLKALDPDLMVVAAYGRILPGRLLTLPPLGAINVHGSLLPKYRGAAPIHWAVINGETETGITIMQMDEGMDTGDMLLPVKEPIGENDTAGELFQRLAELGGQHLTRAIALLKDGRLKPVKQDDSLATTAPMLKKEHGLVDWSKSAEELHCLIRGLDPWPSAYAFLEGKRFRFFRPKVVLKTAREQPGTIARADHQGLLVATGSDYLLITEIQPEGKKRMSVAACLNGTSITAGQRFT